MFDFISRPFGWLLLQIYNLLGSINSVFPYAFALIIFTIIAKLVMLPFSMKSKKGMLDTQRIQPKLKELEKKYKDNKEKYSQEVSKLYKSEGVSMLGGCLPLLITFPILMALYSVIQRPLTFMLGVDFESLQQIASLDAVKNALMTANPKIADFAEILKNVSRYEILIANEISANATILSSAQSISSNIIPIDFNFFWMNLSHTPSFNHFGVLWIFPVLSGASAFLSMRITSRYQGTSGDAQAKQMGQMGMIMPLISVWIGFMVPTGLALYWIINSLLSVVQDPLLHMYYQKKHPHLFVKPEETKKQKIVEVSEVLEIEEDDNSNGQDA